MPPLPIHLALRRHSALSFPQLPPHIVVLASPTHPSLIPLQPPCLSTILAACPPLTSAPLIILPTLPASPYHPFSFLPPPPTFSYALSLPPPYPPFHPTHTSLPPLDPFFYPSPSSVKPIKIDLPRFAGEDPYGWLAMAERYLDYYSVPPFQRVTVAACNFGSNASIWMHWFEQRYPKDDWNLFVEHFLHRFGSSYNAHIETQLSHIQQLGSVEDYIAVFMKLSCHALDWSDSQLKHVYIGGLRDDLKHDVLALEPDSLHQAQKLSKIFQTKNQSRRTFQRLSYPKYSSNPIPPNPPPPPLPQPPRPSLSPSPFRRLSPTQA